MWNDYKNESERIPRIENFDLNALNRDIEVLKTKIEKKLNSIKNVEISINDLLKELNTIYDNYNNKYSFKWNQQRNAFVKKEKLNDFLNNLNKYDYFKELHEQFEMYKRNLPEILNMTSLNKTLNNYIEDIILDLETLKEKDEFMSENYTSFIYNIYKISYEFMKYEIIYNDESKLFNYFTSNEHDFWYINEFIKQDIENIQYSINYIEGLEELTKLIDEKTTTHFMNKEILLSLYKCELKEDFIKSIILKFKKYHEKFHKIYIDLTITETSYSPLVLKHIIFDKKEIKKKYLSLLNEYNDFLLNNNFLIETCNETHLYINNLKLKIDGKLNITKEEFKGIYKLKKNMKNLLMIKNS